MMSLKILFTLLFTVTSSSCYELDILEMDLTTPTSKWFFKNPSDSVGYKPAKVPSTFHMDLLANNMTEDPYYRDNLL